MIINRQKLIEETAGNADAIMDIVDSVLGCLDMYISDDEVAGMSGSGCYCEPITVVSNELRKRGVTEYLAA